MALWSPKPRRWKSTAASARGGAARVVARRRGAAARGFTLLEILVAMAVLSIALVALYQSFASTVNINTTARGLWKAMVWVNSELARIERGPVPSVSIQQGAYPPEHRMAGYTWVEQVSDEQPFPGVSVRKVQLEVTWDSAGVQQHYRSQIYVRPR